MSAAPHTSSRWLWGPTSDLLLGCGGWYFFAFAGLCLWGGAIRQGGGFEALPYMTLLFGTPHYGATLLRIYKSSADRRAYRFFTVYATLAVIALFAVGVHQPFVGSAILTLYLTWSPWHYSGQNYGIASMLLRKRGVAPSPQLKRILYLSFFLSFLLTFLVQHSGGSGSDHFAPLSYAGAGYTFLPLGLPQPWAGYAITLVGLGYVGSWVVGAAGIVRAGGLAACGPALLLMASQSLWFSIPLAARYLDLGQGFEPLSRNFTEYYFLWIAVAHSVQYLWVTSYYARSSGDDAGLTGYSAQTMMAGALAWVLPSIVFAPDLLGRLSYDAGLGILVASAVNIHHFILDGAIWKLRDGRVAKLLLRAKEETPQAPRETAGPAWQLGLLAAAGALCTVLLFYGKFEAGRASDALTSGDTTAAEASLRRLAWAGQSYSEGHRQLGDLLAAEQRDGAALSHYERALELRPSAQTWQALGGLKLRRNDLPGAVEAFRQAVAAAPDQDALHHDLGVTLMRAGDLEGARESLTRARDLNPRRGIHAKMLERVEAELTTRTSTPALRDGPGQ